MTNNLLKYIAAKEATAAGFIVLGIARRDRRWIRAAAPDGTTCVLFRVGKNKWHYFCWEHEVTGSGHDPISALIGGLGDVIDTDAQLRSYCNQVCNAPGCYLTQCAGLYRASVQAYNS